jgi:hypothetical protein
MRKYPVYCHGKIILEHRRHDANSTHSAGKMLKGTVKVLRWQRRFIKRDKILMEVYRAGVKKGRKEYGGALAREVRTRLKEGEWRRAASGTWTLLRYYPGGLLLVSKRYWMARELRYRDEQLHQRNRRIQELIAVVKKERAEIREQRLKIHRLREQNRQTQLRAQNLERQLQEIQESETWKFVLKLAHLRAKVGGR